MAKPERFTAVDFPDEYPRDDVADHEVLMSFNNDEDAIKFREWWHAEASVAFMAWLKEKKP